MHNTITSYAKHRKVIASGHATMRLLIVLLLSLHSQYAEEIMNCRSNSRFKVARNGGNYEIRLCTTRNNCTRMHRFINRNKQCEFCSRIPGLGEQGKQSIISIISCMLNKYEFQTACQNKRCEGYIDSFLNDYCENTSFDQRTTCTSSIKQCVTPTPCTTS